MYTPRGGGKFPAAPWYFCFCLPHRVLLQPGIGLLSHPLQSAGIEGRREARRAHQAGICLCSRFLYQGHVPFPRFCFVRLPGQEKLQRHCLGQDIIDIVKWRLVDVQLPLPACAGGYKRAGCQNPARTVFALQVQPQFVALGRC